MRLGLRAQLLIVSSLLLALPVLGLRAAREVEAFLVETQEQGLASTARAVAIALNERPGIFVTDPGLNPKVQTSPENPPAPTVRIESLSGPIIVDGETDDWADQPIRIVESLAPPLSVQAEAAPSPSPAEPATPLRLRYRLGRHERSIYALFEVRDDVVIRHDSEFPYASASDHVEIALVTADDEFVRFGIHVAGDGSARVSVIGPDDANQPDSRIQAVLIETDDGYRIEARMPRTLVGTRLGIAATDVDDRDTRRVVAQIGADQTSRRETLASVFVPSPELAALVQGLGRARSRLWVLDRRGQVLARAGTLQGSRGPQPPPSFRQRVVMELRPLYGSILAEPTEDFVDQGPEATELRGGEITQALGGASSRWRRRTTDGRAVVLSAAEPVWSEDQVVGAVLAEETTNETLAARNRAFERLFFSIGLVVLAGALTLLLFATRLSYRIRGLRDAVERAIDRQGRVRGDIPPSAEHDEVVDLSRSFGSMLERQRQYTAYLEDLRGRLSHEIRTPVAVVRSSLDNLRLHPIPSPAAIYLDRADEGLSRLVTIVQRMTEASRLEQTLATSDREVFDLARVVSGCVEGYRMAHPSRLIEFLTDATEPLRIHGAPDLVAQLLDKLVENALDFARAGTPVEVRLTRGLGIAFLSVANEGPPLAPDVADRVFESMVSSRPGEDGSKVHLGLGLTIVRAIADFHQASVAATNRPDGQGVVFKVAFPLLARV